MPNRRRYYIVSIWQSSFGVGGGRYEGRSRGIGMTEGKGEACYEDTGGRVCYDDEILHSASLRSE